MTTTMTYRIANQDDPSEYWLEIQAIFVYILYFFLDLQLNIQIIKKMDI